VDTEQPVDDVISALERYNLVRRDEILDTMVLPERCGYPVYDKGFEAGKEQAQALFGRYGNLHLVGRNAEFKHIETDEDIASAAEKLQQIYGSEFDFPPSPKHFASA
jgi:protoporphyrinogen oxidase